MNWRDLPQATADTALADVATNLVQAADQQLVEHPHGELDHWQQLIARLPSIKNPRIQLQADAVGVEAEISAVDRQQLYDSLQQLHPWRKGPFQVCGIDLDAEWRSCLKWDRLAQAISPLEGRLVLDVGCGNGYYGWRMLGAGARLVLGIDPTQLFLMQFEMLRHCLGSHPLYIFPLALEQTPPTPGCFDTIFSMGVFYHRRSPFDHLLALRDRLRPGGELVLETLVIEGERGRVLVPADRYAKMRNVWFLPSVPTLMAWLERAGFEAVRLVNVSPTTIQEQRSTEWMRFESLSDFLGSDDPTLTLEGHPAPTRAILVAQKA